VSQHMEALESANRIRLERSDFKRKILSGERSITDSFQAECCQTMTVMALLMAQRRWADRRAAKLLSMLGLSELKTVGGLTERQRRLVLDALARRSS